MGAGTHDEGTTGGRLSARVNALLQEAGRWHGVVRRRDALDLGLSGAWLDRQLGGLLTRVVPGLYVVEHLRSDLTPMAAAVRSMPHAWVARQSAGHLAGFDAFGSKRFRTEGLRVLARNSVRGRNRLAYFHQSRFVPASHVSELHRLPVTTPARTLVDLAAELPGRALERLVRDQVIAGCPTLDELTSCHVDLARRGRRGIEELGIVLGKLNRDERPLPASTLEDRLDQVLRRRGVTLDRQFRPPWFDGVRYVVDLADPVGRTVVEADSRTFHQTQAAFDDDRHRDRMAVGHGWVVLRIGWRDVVRDAEAVDELVAVILRRRRSSSKDTGDRSDSRQSDVLQSRAFTGEGQGLQKGS